MEGDLLGLGFDQPAVSNNRPQDVQQFEIDFLQLQSPSGQAPPASQFPAAPVPQSLPFLLPPPAQYQHVVVQQQEPVVVQQQEPTVVQQPAQTAKPVQATIAPNNSVEPTNNSTTTPQSTTDTSAKINEIWKPSPLQDEPKDPVLREIKEKFGGRWKLIRSDPYDEYLKASGVGFFARKLAISRAPEEEISVKGNKIHIDSRSTFHNQVHVFILEETVENLVETIRQSTFSSYKDGKLILLMTPLVPGMNRTQEVQRFISEHGELVAIYTCGTSTCRRYFARMADIVTPLNIVG